MTKQELASYPTMPLGDKRKEAMVQYVLDIAEGLSKEDSFKKNFPERAKSIKPKSITMAIYRLEEDEYVQKMFRTLNKQAYSRFFGKVDKVLNKVYERAISDEVDDMVALKAADTFMKHVPKQQDSVDIKVEVDIKDQYKEFLADRKKFMHKLANSDAIDVEIEQDNE